MNSIYNINLICKERLERVNIENAEYGIKAEKIRRRSRMRCCEKSENAEMKQ